MFSLQHLNSNWGKRTICIYFFLYIKLQERLIKIQLAHISKTCLKFRHAPKLSHSVHQGINPPPPKHRPPSYLPSPLQLVLLQAPLFRQFPLYIVFLWPPLPLSPKNWWTPLLLKFFIFNFILCFYVKTATPLPLLKKVIPSFPATSLQKLRSCQAPCFENLAGNSTPQQKGGEHYVSNVFKKIAFF